jgi:hypothetical protein
MFVVKSNQVVEITHRIIDESRMLGDLSERDMLVLVTGFQKLLRGLTLYALDEGDSSALRELSTPEVSGG